MLEHRRPGHRAVQHRLRALPQLPRRQDRHLPDRESGSSGRGLRLCGHGRMGRRPGGVRDGSLRRFQSDQVPQQGKGDGEDQGSHLLSDIFPTGYHGCGQTAGVGTGTTVYVAGAGPVGLACAAACQLLGAAVVIVGDMIPERLAQAKSFGCEIVDLRKDATLAEQIEQIVGEPRGGLRRRLRRLRSSRPRTRRRRGAAGHGAEFARWRSRARAAPIGIPGLYVTGDPGGVDAERQDRHPQHPHRTGLGEVALLPHRPVPGAALQSPADDGDSARQGASRQGRQCHHDSIWMKRRRVTRTSTRARRRSSSSIRTEPPQRPRRATTGIENESGRRRTPRLGYHGSCEAT